MSLVDMFQTSPHFKTFFCQAYSVSKQLAVIEQISITYLFDKGEKLPLLIQTYIFMKVTVSKDNTRLNNIIL